jgi:serine/threonine-protein kinase
VEEEFARALAGRYVIEREVGRGGMATVYLARDLRHDRHVAMKTLHAELAASVGADRFLREIRIAAGLQHPNIIAVFDSGEDAGRLWYTMPYVAGESLRDRLDRLGRLPPLEALAIARQVAAALVDAHAHGVVHRDIKPENILLRDSHAMVADFGIARAQSAAESLTHTGMSPGTPAYMSPEQISGDVVDERSDIFSLGCVLYEMLAGQQPFTAPTRQAMLARRMTGPPAPIGSLVEGVPAQLETVIQRALATAPEDRFATAAEVLEALDRGTDGGIRSPARTAGRRSPALQRAFVIAAAFAIVVASTIVWRAREAGRSEQSAPERSLAVLDFANRSADSADAYLASGLTDEVASRLGELPRLRVKGRRATAATNEGDYLALGRALDVRYLVEGNHQFMSGKWFPLQR